MTGQGAQVVLRWGILGTAAINRLLLGSGGAHFGAVASRSAQRARTYAAEQGIARWHGSYEALLADPEIDAIYVPLPNSLHVEWSIRALEAGKHVLCEKPFSSRPDEVERAFAVAEREGLVLAEAQMWRHHPQVARARDLIAGGAIGRLRLIRAAFSFVERDAADIRLRADLDGGALMDVGTYCVAGCRILAGAEPESVSAQLVEGGEGVDVAMAAALRFPGGVLGVFDCGLAYAAREGLEAVGEDGSLFLDDPWRGRRATIDVHGGDGSMARIELDQADSYALELADFEAAARGERPPLLGRDDALGQARAIAALRRSAREGAAVAP